MAKRLYTENNYIISDDEGELGTFPMGSSYYNETSQSFVLKAEKGSSKEIQIADVADWFDTKAGSNPYSEASLRTFLQVYTGFKTASGSRGAPNATATISSAQLKNLVAGALEIAADPGAGKYFSNLFIRFKFNMGATGYAIAIDSLLTIKMGVIEKMMTTELITASEDSVIELSDFYTDKTDLTEERPFANPVIMSEAISMGMVGANDFTLGDGTLDVELWYNTETF